MEPILKLRPSNADRADKCPASLFPKKEEPLIEIIGDDAGPLGEAAHEMLKHTVRGDDYSFEEICAKHEVESDDVGFLRWAATTCFQKIAKTFPDVSEWIAEDTLKMTEPFEMEGTPDLRGITDDGETLIIFDYKTGRSTAVPKNQLKAYAALALHHAPPTIKRIFTFVGWARDRDIQKWEWSPGDIQRWLERIHERIWGWDDQYPQYAVGAHCTYCRRNASCEARAQSLKAALDLLLTSPTDLEGESLLEAWQASGDIPKIFSQWRDRMKEKVLATGPVDVGDGKELAMKKRNGPAEFDTMETARVLQSNWSFEPIDLLECSKFQKKAIEDWVAKEAPRGQKGTVRKEVIEDLKQQGALVQKEIEFLTVVEKAS